MEHITNFNTLININVGCLYVKRQSLSLTDKEMIVLKVWSCDTHKSIFWKYALSSYKRYGSINVFMVPLYVLYLFAVRQNL